MFPQAQNLLVVDCGGRSWEYYHPSSLHLEVVQKAVSALAVVALLDLGFATLGRADEISRHGTAVPRWWLPARGDETSPRDALVLLPNNAPPDPRNQSRCGLARWISGRRARRAGPYEVTKACIACFPHEEKHLEVQGN
ncbi:hypothetical protein I7I51_01457 [Histoplasma capsulatum]|uniref:Uncharacterized protein n=1 Tax=Ajellomyces capsulatus TaxID=5037 RepID=A0A8A1MGX7_AJECA|nr:hypothetical protein I7I51_01457 [Histoplasma capsulatum]